MRKIIHLLDCLATNPDAVIMFRASEMILNVHSDASYLSEKKLKNRMGGYFFGMYTQEEQEYFYQWKYLRMRVQSVELSEK